MLQGRSELPASVAFQLRTLNDVNEKIEKLEAELSKAREEREHLEAQITKYRASVAPIRRIPSEILTMIFEEYVIDQPTHIRRLLLVCHLWHRLGMGTPRLWTYIQLKLGSDDTKACISALRYAKACYTRSKNALLHIVMDFRGFPSPYDYISNRLATPFHELTANTRYWDDELPDFESLAYSRLIGKHERIAKFMVSQMQRWQSLSIAFKSSETEELFQAIWPLFSRKAPKLVELVMKGVSLWATENQEYEAFFTTSPLTSLTVSDRRIFASIASFGPPLEVLVCKLGGLDDFKYIYPFTGLRSLTLVCAGEVSAAPFDYGKLRLPFLRHLSLKGTVPGTIIQSLDAPAVQDLHIRRASHQRFDGLPNISPVNIVWKVEKRNSYHHKRPASTEDIRTLFEKYPMMQTLVTYTYHKRHTLTLLADIREAVLGLKYLRSITFIEKHPWRYDDRSETERFTVDTCFGRTRDELLASVDDVSEVTSTTSSDDDPAVTREISPFSPSDDPNSDDDFNSEDDD